MKVWLCWGLCVLLICVMRRPEQAGGFYVRADTDSVSVAIVAGDSLMGTHIDGETIEYIYGHVHVTQDSTVLTADQARRMADRRTIDFVGRVQMIDRGDSLAADSLFYDEARKMGWARNNVRLTDGDVIAYAPEGEHFVDEKWSIFASGVRLEDSTTTLIGQSGQYWTREKRAELADSVRMTSGEISLWADSLTHLRDTRQSTARGNVLVEQTDGADTTRITGQWVFHDQQAKRSEVKGFPTLVQLQHDSLSVDTLVVAADYMRLDEPEEGIRELRASGRVQIWNHEFAAVSDSMAYSQAGSQQSVLLYGEPMLWIEDSQVTGEPIRILLTDGALDSLFAYAEAFVAQFDSATGRINQAKGRRLTGVSESDSVRIFMLGPNAESLYHYHEADVGPDGALEASGDAVTLRMLNNKLRSIKFSTGVQGVRHPEESLPAKLSLDGLRWQPEQRPIKEVLLSGFGARGAL